MSPVEVHSMIPAPKLAHWTCRVVMSEAGQHNSGIYVGEASSQHLLCAFLEQGNSSALDADLIKSMEDMSTKDPVARVMLERVCAWKASELAPTPSCNGPAEEDLDATDDAAAALVDSILNIAGPKVAIFPDSFPIELEKSYLSARSCANTTAVALIQDAAEKQHHLAEACLSALYERGCEGLPRDHEQSVLYASRSLPWLGTQARRGNKCAQYHLGYCCEDGRGVGKNETEAVRWYTLAAEQGHAPAQCNLGICCEDGTGVVQDVTEAVRLYTAAAQQGLADAQMRLGMCYRRGNGATRDMAEAARQVRLAAEQGHLEAQRCLIQRADFIVLDTIGKGKISRVLLACKRAPPYKGQAYAMKILRKEEVNAQDQAKRIENERDILYEARHPFIIRLRYAFQSEEKLYLVTDYYQGGTLFFQLRRARQFPEERARFYAAQLLSALDHLHQHRIVYRDVKLENLLLNRHGYIALTNFGLAKRNTDANAGASTFCGTAEYVAPEMLRGETYGTTVDWWSFGILLYEMLHGRTPFFDKNRRLMFYRIINTSPTYPSTFSPGACDCIRGLLRVNMPERLGCGPAAAKEVMETTFFSSIDFDALSRREITPPFLPEVANEFDTKYVPKALLQAVVEDTPEDKPVKCVNNNMFDFEGFTFAG